MKKLELTANEIRRIALCLASGIVGTVALLVVILVPANADAVGPPKPPPRFLEFELATGLTVGTDVYGHHVFWSQYDISNLPPTCVLTETASTGRSANHDAYPEYSKLFKRVHSEETSFFASLAHDYEPTLIPTPLYFDWDICVYDTLTGEMSHVTDSDQPDRAPRVFGNWLVFHRGRLTGDALILKNLETGEEEMIHAGVGFYGPNIHKGTIVFNHATWDDASIMTYDISTAQLTTILPYSDQWLLGSPDIYEQTIVWNQSPLSFRDFDILAYDLTTQETITISAEPGDESGPRIDGNIIVWEWEGSIYGYDLISGERLTITQSGGGQSLPAISGDLVVWSEIRSSGRADIHAYNLANGEEYSVTNDSEEAWWPSVWGNIIAWDRRDFGAAGALMLSEFNYYPIIRVSPN